jgi:fucose 4-O-acetylase-like acetyltransferase
VSTAVTATRLKKLEPKSMFFNSKEKISPLFLFMACLFVTCLLISNIIAGKLVQIQAGGYRK